MSSRVRWVLEKRSVWEPILSQRDKDGAPAFHPHMHFRNLTAMGFELPL